MKCYTEPICLLFVDGELPADEARQLREHLATCRRCRLLVDALRAENHLLSEILHELPEDGTALYPAGEERRVGGKSLWASGGTNVGRAGGWRDLAIVGALLALGSITSLWLDGLNLPAALEWFNPLSLSGRTNLILSLTYYFAHGGTTMLADYAAFVGRFSLLLLLGGGLLLLGRRVRVRLPRLGLLALTLVLVALSMPCFALERRHGELINIPAGQTVDDTLLAAGTIVRIDGVINGDLLAFGRTVEIRGTVKGDVVSFAQQTEVSGTVEGHVFNFSHSLDLEGQVGHSIYGLAQSLRVTDRGRVGEGVVMATNDASIEGEVQRSVDIYTNSADVSGRIGRDLEMAGASLTLTDTARVGGNLRAHVRRLRDVHIADGATITGSRNLELFKRENRFAHPGFYFFQAVWVAAAMLIGIVGVFLFPRFVSAATQAVGTGWLSLALGVAVLAGLPLTMLVAAITLVGLPLSLMLLELYLVAIYLAKIWVGAFLGRMLLKPSGATKGDWIMGLLVGLLILTVVGFIPYLGGLIKLGVVCLGLGAFTAQLFRSARPAVAA